jgi:hypothetical protein
MRREGWFLTPKASLLTFTLEESMALLGHEASI